MKSLTIVLKIILILIGGLMVVGGGFCAATNVMFAIPNLRSPDLSLFATLFGISAGVAVVGWLLLELAGVGWFFNSRRRSKSTTTGNDATEE